MKTYLSEHGIAPEDALHICGALHAASDVEEFDAASEVLWDIPPRTETRWLYGFIPSSHRSIEHQFGHPIGTLTLASTTWKKAVQSLSLTPFTLDSKRSKKEAAEKAKTNKKTKRKAEKPVVPVEGGVSELLTRPPTLREADHEELLRWCTSIVALARKNGYLATTADSIAIYETVTLLARLRSRRHPSANDFVDAAVTCLEKMDVPERRDVRKLCEILFGGDRIGQVGYSSLPPLVQNVYERLEPTGVKPGKTTIVRWVVRLTEQPDLRACSELLWRLCFLLSDTRVARPIMGMRELGQRSDSESWDIKLGGPEQRHLIELAYEGVTVEHVLERRLRQHAFGPDATTLKALTAPPNAASRFCRALDSPRRSASAPCISCSKSEALSTPDRSSSRHGGSFTIIAAPRTGSRRGSATS